MVMPSLLATDTVLNATATGDQSGERVLALSNGSALVTWMVAGGAAPLQGRIVSATGAAGGTVDLVFANVAATASYSLAELPNGTFVVASRIGDAVRLEKFDAAGTSIGTVQLTSSVALNGGPLIETTSDGSIGVYLRTATSAQVGAFDANLNLIVAFDTLILNNGTANAATDADGSVFTLLDGAGIGSTAIALLTTRGTGAAKLVQIHFVSLATQAEIGVPTTVASGAGVDIASVRLVETANGNVVASWIDGTSVRAQIYAGTGGAVGAAIVATATAPTGASAVPLADGGVLLVWSDLVAGQRDILGEVFTAAGVASSAVFTVNSATAGAQTNPSGAVLGNGEVVVAWDSASGATIDVVDRLLSFVRPDAVADAVTVTAGVATTIRVLANDSDPNGDAITLGALGAAAHGTVGASGNAVVYVPAAGYVGPDSFTYTVTDPGGRTDTATVSLTVAAAIVLPSQFFLLVPSGAAATVTGTGQVFGVTGTTQDVTVLDAPGRLSFEGSFNTGGDRIRLSGNASGYTVLRSGATVEISDGDTVVAVPVGTGGADIVFADGVRSLVTNTVTGAVTLGGQALTTSAVQITAAAGTAVATGAADANVGALLLLNAGASATAIGRETVFGTVAGVEMVTVRTGATATFDGSFNAGGDTIALPGAAAGYAGVRSGSTVTLTSAGATVAVPVGIVGATIAFADGSRVLVFDQTANAVKLGTQTIATTSTPLAGVFADGAIAHAGDPAHATAVVSGDFMTFIV